MKMLRNSARELLSLQKQLLYRIYIIPITLYGFSLWFYNKASLSFPLRKIQRRAAIWILGAFYTSPTKEIEALASLIPIYLHLKKLSSRSQLRVLSLPHSHTIWTLLENQHSNLFLLHHLSLENITAKQRQKIKSSITDVNSCLNSFFSASFFSAFNTFNSELSSGFQLSDKFSSHFLFHQVNHKNKKSKDSHLHKLNNLFDSLMIDSNTIIIISNASLKDNITILISYVHFHSEQVKKTIYHAVNITTTKAELFTMRYKINQAILIPNISHIVIITNIIYFVWWIFDLSVHPFQVHSITVAKYLRTS